MRLRQFQRYKAIENWTIIKEVIAIYSMGSKESKETHYNTYYHIWVGSKESEEIALLHSKEC